MISLNRTQLFLIFFAILQLLDRFCLAKRKYFSIFLRILTETALLYLTPRIFFKTRIGTENRFAQAKQCDSRVKG
jgi:hypothetical protein